VRRSRAVPAAHAEAGGADQKKFVKWLALAMRSGRGKGALRKPLRTGHAVAQPQEPLAMETAIAPPCH
jgi:hypothetical protein